MTNKTHYCDNCGEPTEDYDETPDGKKVWICSSSKCINEFKEFCQEWNRETQLEIEYWKHN